MIRRPSAPALAMIAVVALEMILYGRVAHFPFIEVDDLEYVMKNPAVHRGLTADTVRWAFTSFESANWHPLTWLSYMLDVSLFGVNPGGHHLVNLLFHIANGCLLFGLLRRMTGKGWESVLVAALFAIHPLHVESVVWIAERKDVLSTFFWFLTMRLYVEYARAPGPGRYTAVIAAFALGLLSKPMLVTLPFCLLLLDWWPLERLDAGSAKRLAVEKAPMFLMSVAASAVTVLAQRAGEAVASLDHFPLWTRVGNALVSYVRYLAKAAYPVRLSVFYPHPMDSLSLPLVAASFLLLAAVTAAAVVLARKRRWLAVGWFWYLGTLVPVIGIIQVGTQAMADRYTYIPLIGPFIAAAWGASELAARRNVSPRIVGILAAAWIVSLSAVTWRQIGYWRGVVPLFSRAVEVTGPNAFAQTVLGAAAYEAGDDNTATRHLAEALKIRSDFPDAHLNMGLVLMRQGKLDEAETQLREAVRLFPDDSKASINLWILLRRKGRVAEATGQMEAMETRDSKWAEEYHGTGLFLAGQGKFEEAAVQFEQALRVMPDHPDAAYNLGLAYEKLGRDSEALGPFERAVKRNGRDTAARYSLAALYYRLGRIDESIREYETLLKLNPADEVAAARLRTIRQRHG